MAQHHLDHALQQFVGARRSTLRAIVAGAVMAVASQWDVDVEAKKKKKKKPCGASLTRCGKSCVSLASDANNCGGCGFSCGQGQTCSNRSCIGGASCHCRPVVRRPHGAVQHCVA